MNLQHLEKLIKNRTGPRQAGKTTLTERVHKSKGNLLPGGEVPKTSTLLTEPNTGQIHSITGRYKYIFIDEIQRIKGTGLTMKITTDRFKQVQLFFRRLIFI